MARTPRSRVVTQVDTRVEQLLVRMSPDDEIAGAGIDPDDHDRAGHGAPGSTVGRSPGPGRATE